MALVFFQAGYRCRGLRSIFKMGKLSIHVSSRLDLQNHENNLAKGLIVPFPFHEKLRRPGL